MKIKNILSVTFLQSSICRLAQFLLVVFIFNLYSVRIQAQNQSLELEWATYFGGTGIDFLMVTALDSAENIYTSFLTEAGGVLTTEGVHQRVYRGRSDAVIAKFDKEGKLIWSTYFGGNGEDVITGMAITQDGNIAVGGYTTSSTWIATTGAENTQYKGGGDAFVALFNKDRKSVV